MSERVSVPTDAGEMPAHLWLPEAGSGPGLLLLQEIFGISPYIRKRAADLATAGYVVLAPELYWRLDGETPDESTPDAIEKAIARMQRLDWDTTVADSLAALEHLRGRAEVAGDPGVIGFCFGGGLAFEVAARDEPAALVSYYGSALPGLLDRAPQVTAPSLYHHGLADQYIDSETVEQIRKAVTTGSDQVRFETYEGADHAFDNDSMPLHHPAASVLAWERTLEFLGEHLPPTT